MNPCPGDKPRNRWILTACFAKPPYRRKCRRGTATNPSEPVIGAGTERVAFLCSCVSVPLPWLRLYCAAMESSIFSFLAAMFGVLVALGIARLISALASFTTSREPIDFYWVHGAWILFMLLLYLHLWWSLWDLRVVSSWNYFKYLFLLLGPASLYMATSLLVSNPDREEIVDSHEYYFRVHRKFFTSLAVVTVWGMLIYPVFMGKPDPVLQWLLLFLAVVVGLAVTRNEKAHAGLTIAAWVLFLTWVISFGMQHGS